ncbi:calcium channel protein CCH1 [Sporobolomyces salmoneus]|uniref:calcium channel protein CCH1 n=1 Tax=Sporobolomyces salmoneus TaxID=183962 RepID=UPI003177416E
MSSSARERPIPADPTRLEPSSSSSSTSSSLVGSGPPSIQLQHSAPRQRPPPIDTNYPPTATTTAHQRPLSPVSFTGNSAESDTDSNRLHRRSSSRRTGSETETETGDRSSNRLRVGSTTFGNEEEEEAVRYQLEQGWRRVELSPTTSERPRSSVDVYGGVSLTDGSVVRRLPQTPEILSNSSTGLNHRSSPPLNEQAHLSTTPSGSTGFNPVTFDPNYRPSFSRTDSHPLSLDGESFAEISSEDESEQGHKTPRERKLSEEVESRSPLNPTNSTPSSQRARPSLRTPRLSPLFQGLSPNRSPAANRLSPRTSGIGGGGDGRESPSESRGRTSDAGWQELSPSRSPSRTRGLARRQTLTAAIGGLRRASVRVVNIAGADSELLVDTDQRSSETRSPSLRRRSEITIESTDSTGIESQPHVPSHEGDDNVTISASQSANHEPWDQEYQRYEMSFRKLRGKTLFIFGPENRVRRFCARVLTARWTEPIILLLIIFSVIVQTIQSSYNVHEHPRPTLGYFHTWEDYALFAVFICFTIEILARIVVTGLVFNPPRPPSPPRPASEPYESSVKRTPSLASRVDERISPLPSPLRSTPPLLPTQLKGKDAYPPHSSLSRDTSTDITHALRSYNLDENTNSSVSLVRNHSELLTPTRETGRVGLGFFDSTSSLNTVHEPSNESPAGGGKGFSTIKAGLASTLPTASAAAMVPNATTAAAPYVLAIQKQRSTYQQAFLRHSWNRIDAVAVVSFWISFVLAISGLEAEKNLWFFRALSVLRASRLLAVTSGTQTILQSLKKASPLLVRTSFFIAFSMVLFGIIGLQSFRGSYQRYCQWVDPEGVLPSVTSEQNCGGYYNSTGSPVSYLVGGGFTAPEDPKGFLCTFPNVCIELENAWGGARSFDNIFASLLQVVVVASANTWTGSMYAMMDADYFVSCLFFIVALVLINYWFINLFTAVITSTFSDIRDETKHSAFAATAANPRLKRYDDDRKLHRGFTRSTSFVRSIYEKTHLFWVALVVLSVAALAAKQSNLSDRTLAILDSIELGCIIAFDVEIAIRVFASLPDWRTFFEGATNITDTILAFVSTIILIPPIRNSPAYPWLTVFAIARFYRFITAIPRMRRLLTKVLGTFVGLLNMIGFLFLMTFLAALIAVKMFQGIPNPESSNTGTIDFYQIFNSFLGMYQILSSENWTDIVNTVLSSEVGVFQIVISAIFFSAWMFFGFFVIGNLFIAVINENFAIAEEEKKARQLETFINRTVVPGHNVTSTWLRRFDPYNYASARSRSTVRPDVGSEAVTLDEGAEIVTSPDALQTEFGFGEEEKKEDPVANSAPKRTLRFRSGLDGLSMNRTKTNSIDIFGSRHEHQYSSDLAAPPPRNREATIQEHARFESVAEERKNTIREFILENPGYDKTLYLFSQDSKIREICQRLVEPSYGDERIKGRPASKWWKYAFNSVVLLAIIVSISVAAVATPLYRQQMFINDGDLRWNWPNLVEVAVGFVFVLEFLVKIVADGFLFSPNAYLLSLWNDIDFLVLLTLLVNIITSLVGGDASNRFTRALKAFRALRLINLWPAMRVTFYNVLILGFTRILDASILAVLYIVPFAVWGMQIFSGLLYSCNDPTVSRKDQCVGEFVSSVVEGWEFKAPRVWSNPYVWSFDSFRSALLILFEIISLEGWIDVMKSVMQITGRDEQPQENASQFNALFFVLFNVIGATFILTIFLSVIIDNLHRRSATALLTTEQRQWLDLRRLISRQSPSKRPPHRPTSTWRSWCFDRAAKKHGWWTRILTGLYILNIIVLSSEASTTTAADRARDWIYLAFTFLYFFDIVVRITGFGWTVFTQNYWNLYDLLVVSGTLATTIPLLLGTENDVALQLQKLFLVAIVFKLVQRSDSLNQLQKTAVASLPAILNIFALWAVLFLVFAIFYMEVFGLTRWQSHETHNANYYSFGNALVLLILQSTGEGWNQFMHDYASTQFPRCTEAPNYLDSDCGSSAWAYALFIIWNVLSMYLFTNLVLGAVIENFSFVFQDYGKVTNINREQMRSFKEVWQEFDPDRTRYLRKEQIPRFLSRLTGIFDVKIYRNEWSVHSLLGVARKDPATQHDSPSFHHYLQDRDTLSLRRIDLVRLQSAVSAIDPLEVERRKSDYNRLYHEAMLDAETSGKGISFSGMLRLLAHYRLIDDDNALQIDELIQRRAKLQQVYTRVRQDRLDSFFEMIIARRQFLRARQARRRSEIGGVPAIQVDNEPEEENRIE